MYSVSCNNKQDRFHYFFPIFNCITRKFDSTFSSNTSPFRSYFTLTIPRGVGTEALSVLSDPRCGSMRTSEARHGRLDPGDRRQQFVVRVRAPGVRVGARRLRLLRPGRRGPDRASDATGRVGRDSRRQAPPFHRTEEVKTEVVRRLRQRHDRQDASSSTPPARLRRNECRRAPPSRLTCWLYVLLRRRVCEQLLARDPTPSRVTAQRHASASAR